MEQAQKIYQDINVAVSRVEEGNDGQAEISKKERSHLLAVVRGMQPGVQRRQLDLGELAERLLRLELAEPVLEHHCVLLLGTFHLRAEKFGAKENHLDAKQTLMNPVVES